MNLLLRKLNQKKAKKARVTLNVKYKVTHVLACDDASIDKSSLVGRIHFESYMISESFGVAMIIKTILGIVGAKFKDKSSWKQLISSFREVLEQLKAEKIQFGATVETKERKGYENTNIVLKEKAFLSIENFASALE